MPYDLIPAASPNGLVPPALFSSDTDAAWCESHGIGHLREVQPVHVAAYVEDLLQRMAAPSVKLQLAGIRTRISCHTFRATGITEYRRNAQVLLDEVERILI